MATSSPAMDSCVHFHPSKPNGPTTGQPLQFVDGSVRFEPVDSLQKQIRILYLLPHSTSENIFCKLHVESLFDNPTFEALSYCWGTPNNPVSIDVNGHEFKVTQNLKAALKSLIPGPDNNGPRKLWIDAICINQGHSENALKERTMQVMLMGDIYIGASSVTAYLGEPFEGLDQAMRYLESSAANPAMHFDPQKSPYNQSGGDATSKPLNLALLKFFSYPWWTRMWIVQEYFLAKQVYFQIGSIRFAGEVCAEAVQHLLDHQDAGCCDRRSFPFHGQLNNSGGRKKDTWAYFSRLQSLENTSRLEDILDGLGRFSGREASDPRDKIFALRSLCEESDKDGIQVNYERCVRCVFVDFTLGWVKQHKNLTILSYLGMPRGRAVTPVDTPSFAINWGKSPRQGDLASWHRRAVAQAGLFRACGDTRPSESWGTGSSDSVIADGFLFDDVKTVVGGFRGNFYDPDSFVGWLNTTRFLLKDLVYSKPREAMIRATCSDLMYGDGGFSRISDSHYTLLEIWWEEVIRLYGIPQGPQRRGPPIDYPYLGFFNTETVPKIREPITTTALGRDIIVTAKGYLALAPERCQPGDKVAVMAGGAVPIILREMGVEERDDQSLNLNNAGKASYEVVGDAYVHGIMDGEAFTLCGRDEKQLDQLILV